MTTVISLDTLFDQNGQFDSTKITEVHQDQLAQLSIWFLDRIDSAHEAGHNGFGPDNNTYIDDGNISIGGTRYYGGGGYETDSITIPLTVFLSEHSLGQYTTEYFENQRRLKKEAEAKEAEARAAAKEANEKAEFERLKLKFQGS